MQSADDTAAPPLTPPGVPPRTTRAHGFVLILISCLMWGLVSAVLIGIASKFGEIYDSYDVELPGLTILALSAAGGLRQWWYIAAPTAGVILGGLLALSLVCRSKVNYYIGLVLLFGSAVVLALAAAGILLPLKRLMEAVQK